MKVLDIYPDGCWSLTGVNEQTIAKLRAAVSIADQEDRELALSHIFEGQAFRFLGDPTKFQFAPGFFDKVNLMFAPDISNRVQLRQCIRRWSKNAPHFSIEEKEQDAPAQSAGFGPIISRYIAKLIPPPAT